MVVHAVVPKWDTSGRGNAKLLMKQAVYAALAVAESKGAKEVAIPLCGSGIYGWPAREAAEAVVGALVSYAADPASKLRVFDLVDFDASKANASAKALTSLCGPASKAAQATSMVPLPEKQWFYDCSESGPGPAKDGFQPYDYDQTQQIEAAWAAYIDGSGSSKLEIQGDAGGVKSDSKFGNKYAIYFQPQSSD